MGGDKGPSKVQGIDLGSIKSPPTAICKDGGFLKEPHNDLNSLAGTLHGGLGILAKPPYTNSGPDKDFSPMNGGLGGLRDPQRELMGIRDFTNSPNVNARSKLGHLVTLSDSANFLGHSSINSEPGKNHLSSLKGNKKLVKTSSGNLGHNLEGLSTLSDSGSSFELSTNKLKFIQGNITMLVLTKLLQVHLW